MLYFIVCCGEVSGIKERKRWKNRSARRQLFWLWSQAQLSVEWWFALGKVWNLFELPLKYCYDEMMKKVKNTLVFISEWCCSSAFWKHGRRLNFVHSSSFISWWNGKGPGTQRYFAEFTRVKLNFLSSWWQSLFYKC